MDCQDVGESERMRGCVILEAGAIDWSGVIAKQWWARPRPLVLRTYLVLYHRYG